MCSLPSPDAPGSSSVASTLATAISVAAVGGAAAWYLLRDEVEVGTELPLSREELARLRAEKWESANKKSSSNSGTKANGRPLSPKKVEQGEAAAPTTSATAGADKPEAKTEKTTSENSTGGDTSPDNANAVESLDSPSHSDSPSPSASLHKSSSDSSLKSSSSGNLMKRGFFDRKKKKKKEVETKQEEQKEPLPCTSLSSRLDSGSDSSDSTKSAGASEAAAGAQYKGLVAGTRGYTETDDPFGDSDESESGDPQGGANSSNKDCGGGALSTSGANENSAESAGGAATAASNASSAPSENAAASSSSRSSTNVPTGNAAVPIEDPEDEIEELVTPLSLLVDSIGGPRSETARNRKVLGSLGGTQSGNTVPNMPDRRNTGPNTPERRSTTHTSISPAISPAPSNISSTRSSSASFSSSSSASSPNTPSSHRIRPHGSDAFDSESDGLPPMGWVRSVDDSNPSSPDILEKRGLERIEQIRRMQANGGRPPGWEHHLDEFAGEDGFGEEDLDHSNLDNFDDLESRFLDENLGLLRELDSLETSGNTSPSLGTSSPGKSSEGSDSSGENSDSLENSEKHLNDSEKHGKRSQEQIQRLRTEEQIQRLRREMKAVGKLKEEGSENGSNLSRSKAVGKLKEGESEEAKEVGDLSQSIKGDTDQNHNGASLKTSGAISNGTAMIIPVVGVSLEAFREQMEAFFARTMNTVNNFLYSEEIRVALPKSVVDFVACLNQRVKRLQHHDSDTISTITPNKSNARTASTSSTDPDSKAKPGNQIETVQLTPEEKQSLCEEALSAFSHELAPLFAMQVSDAFRRVFDERLMMTPHEVAQEEERRERFRQYRREAKAAEKVERTRREKMKAGGKMGGGSVKTAGSTEANNSKTAGAEAATTVSAPSKTLSAPFSVIRNTAKLGHNDDIVKTNSNPLRYRMNSDEDDGESSDEDGDEDGGEKSFGNLFAPTSSKKSPEKSQGENNDGENNDSESDDDFFSQYCGQGKSIFAKNERGGSKDEGKKSIFACDDSLKSILEGKQSIFGNTSSATNDNADASGTTNITPLPATINVGTPDTKVRTSKDSTRRQLSFESSDEENAALDGGSEETTEFSERSKLARDLDIDLDEGQNAGGGEKIENGDGDKAKQGDDTETDSDNDFVPTLGFREKGSSSRLKKGKKGMKTGLKGKKKSRAQKVVAGGAKVVDLLEDESDEENCEDDLSEEGISDEEDSSAGKECEKSKEADALAKTSATSIPSEGTKKAKRVPLPMIREEDFFGGHSSVEPAGRAGKSAENVKGVGSARLTDIWGNSPAQEAVVQGESELVVDPTQSSRRRHKDDGSESDSEADTDSDSDDEDRWAHPLDPMIQTDLKSLVVKPFLKPHVKMMLDGAAGLEMGWEREMGEMVQGEDLAKPHFDNLNNMVETAYAAKLVTSTMEAGPHTVTPTFADKDCESVETRGATPAKAGDTKAAPATVNTKTTSSDDASILASFTQAIQQTVTQSKEEDVFLTTLKKTYEKRASVIKDKMQKQKTVDKEIWKEEQEKKKVREEERRKENEQEKEILRQEEEKEKRKKETGVYVEGEKIGVELEDVEDDELFESIVSHFQACGENYCFMGIGAGVVEELNREDRMQDGGKSEGNDGDGNSSGSRNPGTNASSGRDGKTSGAKAAGNSSQKKARPVLLASRRRELMARAEATFAGTNLSNNPDTNLSNNTPTTEFPPIYSSRNSVPGRLRPSELINLCAKISPDESGEFPKQFTPIGTRTTESEKSGVAENSRTVSLDMLDSDSNNSPASNSDSAPTADTPATNTLAHELMSLVGKRNESERDRLSKRMLVEQNCLHEVLVDILHEMYENMDEEEERKRGMPPNFMNSSGIPVRM